MINKSKLLRYSYENYRKKFLNKFDLLKMKTVSKRRLSLNGDELKINFIKISLDEIKNGLSLSNYETARICYLITWTDKIDLSKINSSVDLIVCDLNWKIIKCFNGILSTKALKFENNSHLFIMHQNSINFYDFQEGDILQPF